MAKERVLVTQTTMIEKYDGDMNLQETYKSKVPDHLKDKVHKSKGKIAKEKKNKKGK